MEILKASSDWAKADLLSNTVFALFGILFLVISLGIWAKAETDMARAFVIPTLVAGILLLILGVGLFYGTWNRLTGFETSIALDPSAFVEAEIARIDKTRSDYATAAFTVMPAIILVCAALFLVLQGPVWRAGLITVIAMLTIIIAVDSTASARLAIYKDRLQTLGAP